MKSPGLILAALLALILTLPLLSLALTLILALSLLSLILTLWLFFATRCLYSHCLGS